MLRYCDKCRDNKYFGLESTHFAVVRLQRHNNINFCVCRVGYFLAFAAYSHVTYVALAGNHIANKTFEPCSTLSTVRG